MAGEDKLEKELSTLRIAPEKRAALTSRLPWGKWLRYALPIAVAVVLLIVLIGWLRPAAIEVEVAYATATEAPAAVVLIASGYVVPHHKIELGSKVMGKVAWVGVEKGDRVRAGQVLVRLDDAEYRAGVEQARAALAAAQARLTELERGSRPEEIARAQAEMEKAEAELQLAAANRRRIEGLARDGIVSAQALDAARAQFDVAQKRFQAVQKDYELARLGPRVEQIEQARAEVERTQAVLAFAEAQLEATRIRAPVTGTILERLVEVGEMVTTSFAGERGAKAWVMSLADLSDIQVELDINQNDFPRVFLEQPCDVVLESYPDVHYRGEVVEIAPEADRQKGTIQVKVQILAPDERVRPEMIARVSLEQPGSGISGEPMVTIPRVARVERAGQAVVFVVREGRAHLQPVRTRAAGHEQLLVSEGLQGGELVVIRGQERLEDGSRVRVKR